MHHTIVAHGGFTDRVRVGRLAEAAARAGGREVVIGKVLNGDLTERSLTGARMVSRSSS